MRLLGVTGEGAGALCCVGTFCNDRSCVLVVSGAVLFKALLPAILLKGVYVNSGDANTICRWAKVAESAVCVPLCCLLGVT